MERGHTPSRGARSIRAMLMILSIVVLTAPAASAHYLSEDSVDAGEIRYGDSTQWDDSRTWSIARWNELPGGVNVAPDDAWHIEDLTFSDYSANDGLCGYWDGNSGADDIKLNNSNYNGYTTGQRRACTLHELGHAHRLAHSYSTEVMDSCPVCTTYYTYPQSHDKSDYDGIW